MGPYSAGQLAALRRRGQFGRANEVSLNGGETWKSAEEIEDLFVVKSAGTASSESPTPTRQERGWHFVDEQGTPQGPISQSQITDLAQQGKINGKTLVCQDGDSEWNSAAKHLFLSRAITPRTQSRRRYQIVAVCSFALIVGAGLLLVLLFNGPQNKGDSGSEQDDRLQILTLKNEPELSGAIGRTVCCRRITLPNGSVIEIPKSHGTAFAITNTGYFLTNRHVVEDLAASHDSQIKIDGVNIEVKNEDIAFLFLGKLRFAAKVVHTSSRFDMAVLKITRTQPQRYFALSSQTSVDRRTEVIALGFPALASEASGEESKMLEERFSSQLEDAFKAKCSVNVETLMPVSAFEYSAEDGKTSRIANDTSGTLQIFHSAKIFPGNSGGPLVNNSAVVIGINTLFRRDISKVGDQVVSGDNIYVALAIGQMRDEIAEYVPDPVNWIKEENSNSGGRN